MHHDPATGAQQPRAPRRARPPGRRPCRVLSRPSATTSDARDRPPARWRPPGPRPPRARRPPNALVRWPAASASGSTPDPVAGAPGEDRVGREPEPGRQLDHAVALPQAPRRRAPARASPGPPGCARPATTRRASGHGVTTRSACAVVVIVLPLAAPGSAAMQAARPGESKSAAVTRAASRHAPRRGRSRPRPPGPRGARPPRPARPPCDRGLNRGARQAAPPGARAEAPPPPTPSPVVAPPAHDRRAGPVDGRAADAERARAGAPRHHGRGLPAPAGAAGGGLDALRAPRPRPALQRRTASPRSLSAASGAEPMPSVLRSRTSPARRRPAR